MPRESVRPGATFGSATDLGNLTSPKSRTDMVMGQVDQTHLYRFELLTPRSVEIRATGMNNWTQVRLYRDLNGNGQPDSNEQYLFASSPSNAADSNVFLPGTYFIIVSVSGTVSTPYTLMVTPGAEVPVLPIDPGTSPDTAYNLGSLSTQPITVSDMLMRGVDDVDYFRLQNNTVGPMRVTVSGLSSSIRVRVIHNGTTIATRSGSSNLTIDLERTGRVLHRT